MILDEDELLKVGYPPRFIKSVQTYTLKEKTPLTIEVEVDANPTAVFMWYVNGRELKPSPTVSIVYGTNMCRITLQEPEEGEYRVEARNEEGMSVSIGCAAYESKSNNISSQSLQRRFRHTVF